MYEAHETRYGWLVVVHDPKDGERIDVGMPFMPEEDARLWARLFNVRDGIY